MTAELWLEKPCEHEFVGSHWQDDPKPDDPKNQFHCPGGSRVRLDPDKVVFPGFTIGSEYVGSTAPSLTVQDVIDALEEAANG